MQTQTQSPLKTYLDHLERGELAYQFSPAANRAVFYPFAEFSPEWQAIRFAVARNVSVRFMDLPQAHRMAEAVVDAESEASEAAPPSEPIAKKVPKRRRTRPAQPLSSKIFNPLSRPNRSRRRKASNPASTATRRSAREVKLRVGMSWCLTCSNTGSMRLSSGL